MKSIILKTFFFMSVLGFVFTDAAYADAQPSLEKLQSSVNALRMAVKRLEGEVRSCHADLSSLNSEISAINNNLANLQANAGPRILGSYEKLYNPPAGYGKEYFRHNGGNKEPVKGGACDAGDVLVGGSFNIAEGCPLVFRSTPSDGRNQEWQFYFEDNPSLCGVYNNEGGTVGSICLDLPPKHGQKN